MASPDATDTAEFEPVVLPPEPRGRLYRACVRLLVERGNFEAVKILRGLDPWEPRQRDR